jgi:hypothetical protein
MLDNIHTLDLRGIYNSHEYKYKLKNVKNLYI